MTTTLHFHGGDLHGTYDLSDPSIPQAVLDFWSAVGDQVGGVSEGYVLAGLFETDVDEQRGEVLPVESSLGRSILLGRHAPLTAPLRCRTVGGALM